MKRPWQPEWASEEESKLADEWLSSGSDMDIVEYITAHASEKLLNEYLRQKKALKGRPRGHVVLPDGDIEICDADMRLFMNGNSSQPDNGCWFADPKTLPGEYRPATKVRLREAAEYAHKVKNEANRDVTMEELQQFTEHDKNEDLFDD